MEHRILIWSTIRPSLPWPFAPWRKAMRSAQRQGSSRWIRNTVCLWLDRAAQHCRLVMLHLWQRLPVRECQLDELWSFVHTKDEHLAWAKISREPYGEVMRGCGS